MEHDNKQRSDAGDDRESLEQFDVAVCSSHGRFLSLMALWPHREKAMPAKFESQQYKTMNTASLWRATKQRSATKQRKSRCFSV
jgi:hypothetical protein